MTSAQAEGIPVLSATPHSPPFRGDVFQRIIVICNPYVGPPRLAIDRFDVRQCTGHDRVGIVSVLQRELSIAFSRGPAIPTC